MDKIFKAYQTVIGIKDDSVVATILENLNQNKTTSTYFTDIVYTLEILAIDERGRVQIGHAGRGGKNILKRTPIAKGAFGEIFKNKAGTMIYKKILISGVAQKREFLARQTFLEAFIQTVLGLDPEYGKNICHIHKIYRAAETVRHTPRSNSSDDLVIYIVMEPIAHTLANKVEMLTTNSEFTLKMLSPYFSQLGYILDGLKRKYNFSHRDLHTGNMMIRDDDTVALIDFGASCFTINDVTYSINHDNIVHPNSRNMKPSVVDVPCESYDILMFLIAFAEGYGVALPEAENEKLVKLLDTRDRSFNVLAWIFDRYMDSENAKRPEAAYHMTYMHDIKNEWPADIVAKLPLIPGLVPINFAKLSEGLDRNMRAGGKSRRNQRKLHRKTRKH